MAAFKLPDGAQAPTTESEQVDSFVSTAFKRRKTSRRSQYMDVAFVPPTSNECERFFSAAKLVFTDLRQGMEPATLEMVMLLMMNKSLRAPETVLRIREQMGGNNGN